MVQGKEATVVEFVVHRIGAGGEESIFNDHSAVIKGDEEQAFLRRFFLKPFAAMGSTSEFTPGDKRSPNLVEACCKRIEAGEELVPCSLDIGRHLEAACQEHARRGGEFFVVKFTDVEVAGEVYEALGIFQFEDKEVFLESKLKGTQLGLRLGRGLGTRKPDMACLVVFTGDAPTLFIIDDPSTSELWRRSFLNERPKRDHVNSTRNVLDMTKRFITQELPHDYEIPKADQIDLLNRSVQYFKENTDFDRTSFAREVFE
ncbi:MAG: nucleoid-associated protein, partial [Flavobacteriales bacterium]|nr:nucleoid-associated protein [Flavobacteriales bacterium]